MLFENPDRFALNELILSVKEEGVQKKIPALSSHWVQPRCYTKFKPLPIENDRLSSDSALLDEWIAETNWFNKDMEWLLELESYQFWSHMIYDKGCIESVISCLQEATPSYIPITTLTENEKVIKNYSDALRNVLTIICRLITNKESEVEWIDKKYFAEILYTKFLISIPMLFDLISTYGRSNATILKRIFQMIMKVEPKYENDLKLALQYIQRTFKIVQDKCEIETTLNALNDLTLHTLDCAFIMSILFEVYEDARTLCTLIKLDLSISEFYENTIPLLYEKIYNIDPDSYGLGYLNHARVELLASFRSILYQHIEGVLQNPNQSLVPAEMFLNSLTESVSNRVFLIDYHKLYPIEVDMDIITQSCSKIDKFKIEFIMHANAVENGHEKEPGDGEDDNRKMNGYHNVVAQELNQPSSSNVMKSPSRSNKPIEERVKNVLDVLPHLGDGFVRKLLERYETAEQAISAVLECNLPPDLEMANHSEIYIPPDPQDTVFLETGIRRINIYDGDEYDVMTQDNPKGIIKKGKGLPGQPKNLKALLDDKSHVQAMKDRYQEYTMVTEDVDDYDDEYDDSFDAMADSETKSSRGKFKAAKNILVDEIDDESSDEEEPDDSNQKTSSGQRSKIDFCENPEVIRARYEANRQSKFMARGIGGGRARDVVGKPKGQGQDEKVVHNRQAKEAHKSSRANHSRKQGANFKRSRGMFS